MTPPLRQGHLGRAVLRNLSVLFGGRVGMALLQFVAFAAIAAHLGPEGLGVYSLAVAFASLFATLPSFGLQPTAVRDVTQRPELEATLVPNLVYVRLVLGLVAYGLLVATVGLGGYDDLQRDAALVSGTLLFLLALSSFTVVLQVRLRQGWIAAADLTKAVTLLVGAYVLVALDAGVLAFLWLYVGANALNALVVYVAARRVTRVDWRVRPRVVLPTLRAAAPLAAAGLLTALYFRVDMAILARLKPAADVGEYGAAYRFVDTFLLVPVVLMSVLAPVLAESVGAGFDVLRRRYTRIVHLISLLAAPVAVAGALTASRLLPVIPGFDQYQGAGVALAILSPAAALVLIGFVVQGVLVAGHEQRRLLRIAAGGLVLTVVLNIVLVPPFSFRGAAVATVITEVFSIGWSLIEVRRRLGLRWPVARLPRLLAANALLALVLVLAWPLHPVAQLALGVAAYVPAVVLTGALRWEDLEGIVRGDGRHVVLVADPTLPAGGATVAAGAGAAWRATRGAQSCEVVAAAGPVLRLALAARLGGCTRVSVVVESDHLPRWPVAVLLPALVDEAVVRGDDPQAAVARLPGRLRRIARPQAVPA